MFENEVSGVLNSDEVCNSLMTGQHMRHFDERGKYGIGRMASCVR